MVIDPQPVKSRDIPRLKLAIRLLLKVRVECSSELTRFYQKPAPTEVQHSGDTHLHVGYRLTNLPRAFMVAGNGRFRRNLAVRSSIAE
jgi:hypothetical protein